MASSALERVLSCPTLPSLPGVAVRVLELTRDPNVSMTTMAQTVQADPALAVKVLKTVNSSYYGLTTPCPSITRAVSMLGMNTVKAIVLGFSLVDSSKAAAEQGFDMAAYWRRTVHCAAAARTLALRTSCCDPEEAFIAAILQDIGMLACFAALRGEYLDVLREAHDDHDLLCAAELRRLGFDHAKVGRLLAEHWRLPHQLLDCIGAHHNISGASPEHEAIVRVVYLAGQAAGAIILGDKRKLGEFVTRAREWFAIEPAGAKEILTQAAEGAKALARALEVKTGAAADVSAILSEAREQMVAAQEAVQEETAQLRRDKEELARRNAIDGLTGAFNRAHFDKELKAAFERAKAGKTPLGVIFIDADKFKSVNDVHGHQTGDAVLIELAARLRSVGGESALLYRYGGEEFALLLEGADLAATTRTAERLRIAVAEKPFDLRAHGVGLSLAVTISVGSAAMEPRFANSITAAEQITHGADRGVYAAKAAGRNCVRAVDLGAPQASATPGSAAAHPRTVMVVEDDPLAARLMSFLFAKCKDLKPVVVKSGEEALEWVANPSAARPSPDLIVSDLNLPGVSGIDLIKLMRQKATKRRVPFLIVTATADAANQAASLGAGADAFIDKAEFCTNTDHWLATIARLIEQSRAMAA